MKLILTIEIQTELKEHGNRGTMPMFRHTKEITLSLRDICTLTETQTCEGYPVSNLRVLGDSLVGISVSEIPLKKDSLEYYQELKRKGWTPVTQYAKAIQAEGYKNFRPEEFD